MNDQIIVINVDVTCYYLYYDNFYCCCCCCTIIIIIAVLFLILYRLYDKDETDGGDGEVNVSVS